MSASKTYNGGSTGEASTGYYYEQPAGTSHSSGHREKKKSSRDTGKSDSKGSSSKRTVKPKDLNWYCCVCGLGPHCGKLDSHCTNYECNYHGWCSACTTVYKTDVRG